jgi:hypothetical protein
MDAYNRLEKDIEKHGVSLTCKKTIELLVRLTKNYKDNELEKIITSIMKADIFVYVFFPKHSAIKYPEQSQITCPAKWMALLQEDISFILSKNKAFTLMGLKFDIDDLWVSKSDADRLLHIHTEADTKEKQITDEVTNKFWRNNLDNDKPPKSVEIIEWIIDTYALSRKSAESIDSICRPERFRKGGTKPLK